MMVVWGRAYSRFLVFRRELGVSRGVYSATEETLTLPALPPFLMAFVPHCISTSYFLFTTFKQPIGIWKEALLESHEGYGTRLTIVFAEEQTKDERDRRQPCRPPFLPVEVKYIELRSPQEDMTHFSQRRAPPDMHTCRSP